jgi:hypothetical protein
MDGAERVYQRISTPGVLNTLGEFAQMLAGKGRGLASPHRLAVAARRHPGRRAQQSGGDYQGSRWIAQNDHAGRPHRLFGRSLGDYGHSRRRAERQRFVPWLRTSVSSSRERLSFVVAPEISPRNPLGS